MPENLASRVDFALFLALLLLLSQILQFWETFCAWLETALWQCWFNAALVIKHSRQCPCIRPEQIFQAPQEEGPHGLCDKSQDAIFKTGNGEALGDFKSNQCLDNRTLLPPCLHCQVPPPNPRAVF